MLDEYLSRRTVDEFITDIIGDHIFKASQLFATDKEDYDHLISIRDKEHYDENYWIYFYKKYKKVVIFDKRDLYSAEELADIYSSCKGLSLEKDSWN